MTDADNLNKTFNDQIRNEKYRGITYFNSRFDWSESQLDWLIKMGINSSIAVIIANEKFTPSEINQKLFNLTFDFNQDDYKFIRTEKYWNNIDKIKVNILQKRYTLYCVEFYLKNKKNDV